MVRRRKPPDGRANNGGARQGTPGTAYANRSDLAAQPVATAKGQEYGKATAQAEAQRAVPLAQMPPPPTAQASAAPPPGSFAGPYPGEVTGLDAPTERPREPLTHGLSIGPGGGPEVLGPEPADPDLESMRQYLPALELMASQPNSSPTARAFVRRLRGSMPPPGQ